MRSFSNDFKIENVNTKFVISILNETIKRLDLLQCAEFAESQRKFCVEDTTTAAEHKKFAIDLNNIKTTFSKIISHLEKHQTFEDFSGISVAENEANLLTDYNLNKTRLSELSTVLHKLEEDIANYCPTHTENVDETTIKFAMQNRFIKKWEKARRDQTNHFYRMQVDSPQNELNECLNNIKSEERSIIEIETFYLSEMEMHKEESLRWSQKFYDDLNKMEMDIQVATDELEGMKIDNKNIDDAIKLRDEEMVDFVALKEERILQKDSDVMKLIYAHKDHLFAKCRIN